MFYYVLQDGRYSSKDTPKRESRNIIPNLKRQLTPNPALVRKKEKGMLE
jgi:hypothetical protein